MAAIGRRRRARQRSAVDETAEREAAASAIAGSTETATEVVTPTAAVTAMANEGTTQTGSAVDKVQSDAGSILATAPEVTAPDGVEVKAPDANPATGGVRSRTNGAMASTAGKATRKRKRVTFAVKPDGDVAHEAESTAAMAGSAEVVTNVTRSGDGH
ncbi:hypothetical protein PF005_g2253 [Phytophthora fragariae]|uniref:Uncharacterized protein n=1 Tax=Phytophthora fragariae TaxID=53985 RepID=A0A6A3IGJ9_9STRA|nr:hypothetical protein PF011_g22765 [Phytophthora fragariae]KAE9233665.1 hypothetical protein PF005_g2253 [Phytophthora fragariae]